VTINRGKTSKTLRLPTTQDVLNEADETFNVNLSAPTNATIADGTGQATILDNDPEPTLSINDVTRNEGGVFVFTVTLSAASGQQVRVHYDTVDGTATAPGDYTAASNNLTFTPGQLTRTISISSINDLLVEPSETFSVHLSAPIKATIADADGAGTIVDND
jgi:large repetitive protein